MIKKIGIDTYLSNVQHGWCDITILNENSEKFEGRVSYITDFPFDVMSALKKYIEHQTMPVIECDEEGSYFMIVIDSYNVYIIIERDKTNLFKFDIDRDLFVEKLLQDVESNIDAFANFTLEDDDEIIKTRKKQLLSDIKYIRENINCF